MIMDRTLLFSDAQPITAAGSTTSLNTVDLGPTGTPYGASTALAREVGTANLPVTFNVTTSFNNLTGFQIILETDTTPAFSAPTMVFQSPVYALADVQSGARYLLPDTIPVGTKQRYLRARYVVTGTAPTTGAVTGGAVAARQQNSRY